jgi:hypothetical protein
MVSIFNPLLRTISHYDSSLLTRKLESTQSSLYVSNRNNVAIVIFYVALRASLLFFRTTELRTAPNNVASWTTTANAKLFAARLVVRPLSFAHLF